MQSILKKSKYGTLEEPIKKEIAFAKTNSSAVSEIVIERDPITEGSKSTKVETQILSRFRATRIHQ